VLRMADSTRSADMSSLMFMFISSSCEVVVCCN
jgi:hypothetical protein